MTDSSEKTGESTSSSRHEIRRTKDQPGALMLALAKFRERQIKVLDFWVEDGVLNFKIMKQRGN